MKQETIDKLDKIGFTYKCELFLSPFNKSNNPFYYIGDIKNKGVEFRDFFKALDKLDISFKYVEINGKKNYMEVFE